MNTVEEVAAEMIVTTVGDPPQLMITHVPTGDYAIGNEALKLVQNVMSKRQMMIDQHNVELVLNGTVFQCQCRSKVFRPSQEDYDIYVCVNCGRHYRGEAK